MCNGESRSRSRGKSETYYESQSFKFMAMSFVDKWLCVGDSLTVLCTIQRSNCFLKTVSGWISTPAVLKTLADKTLEKKKKELISKYYAYKSGLHCVNKVLHLWVSNKETM